MGESSDILIVGAGVIGVCTAYELSKLGHRVTLVDQGDVCAGSSYGNAGLIVPSHCVPLSEPGVIGQGLKWMLDPESPFYIKPRLDRDLISWLWKFKRSCTHKHVERAVPIFGGRVEYIIFTSFDHGFRGPITLLGDQALIENTPLDYRIFSMLISNKVPRWRLVTL